MSTNTYTDAGADAAAAAVKLCIAMVTSIRLNFLSMHQNLARKLQQQQQHTHTQYLR